jgi:predicted acyl esterase
MLFEPKLQSRGTQLAGWVPSPQSQPVADGILFDEDIAITMSDGVTLLGDLFRPAGMGKVPVLIAWAVYIKDTERLGGGPFIDEAGVSPYVIKCGYAILRVQPRGTGRSGGAPGDEMFTPSEMQDCCETVEWAGTQDWCDGSVGMIGMSAFGVSQLMAAAARPPRLKAIFPYKAFTDLYRHGFYKGGAPYTGAMDLFALAEKLVPPKIPSGVRHALSNILNLPRFARKMSDAAENVRGIHKMMKKMPPSQAAIDNYVRRIYDHPFDDGTYYRGSSPCERIEAIDIPICIATDYGAQGFHFFGAFELWHRVTAPKKMFFGPPEYEFPWSNYLQELVAWYDWTLKGIDNGYAALPPIRYWLRGADRWEHASDWPLPDTSVQRLYLQAGALADEAVTGGIESFVSIPQSTFYPATLDKYEKQVLTFASAPYTEAVEVTGPVKLRLMISATAIDTYIVARLANIAPDGTKTKLAWGWLMASHRQVDEARSNPTEIVHDHRSSAALQLVPGEPTEMLFSLTPIANLFRPGHRMVLEVASRPDLMLSEAGEGFDMFNWDPVPYRCRTSVHLGESFIEVRRK